MSSVPSRFPDAPPSAQAGGFNWSYSAFSFGSYGVSQGARIAANVNRTMMISPATPVLFFRNLSTWSMKGWRSSGLPALDQKPGFVDAAPFMAYLTLIRGLMTA